MEPSTEITFLGKRLDSVARSITNTSGMLVATMRLWVRALDSGRATPREMARLMGRLQWVGRPMPGTALFLAGCCRAMHAGSVIFTRSLACSTATILVMAFPRHRLQQRHRQPKRSQVFFTDTAEAERGRFRAGVVGLTCVRHG